MQKNVTYLEGRKDLNGPTAVIQKELNGIMKSFRNAIEGCLKDQGNRANNRKR